MSASKWPKRLALTGVVMLAISMAVVWSEYDDIVEIMDPTNENLLALEDGESGEVNISKSHSYLIFRLKDTPVNCTITEVATGAEVDIDNPSFIFNREGTNGKIYHAVGSFVPEASGMHLIENTGENNGTSLWVVDEYELDGDSNSLYLFQAGCYGLLCGGCLLPISFLGWFVNRKKGQQPGLVMQTEDGRVVPIGPSDAPLQQRIPTTDEVWRSVHGGEAIDLTVQQAPPSEPEVPAPFADRPDRVGELAKVVDEIETVDDSTPESSDEEAETTERNWKTWDEG